MLWGLGILYNGRVLPDSIVKLGKSPYKIAAGWIVDNCWGRGGESKLYYLVIIIPFTLFLPTYFGTGNRNNIFST